MFNVFLFILSSSAVAFTSSSDDIVINRPLNRVEFSDLLLEYNHNFADEPTNAVEVEVALNIEQAKWAIGYSKELVIIVEFYESWRDSRLKFSGKSSVTVPHGTTLWTPDTYLVNSFDAHWQAQTSLRLRHDGIVFRKRKLKASIPCGLDLKHALQEEQANCTLIFGSFDNAGASSITYRISEVKLPNSTTNGVKFVSDFTNSTTSTKTNTFNGESLWRSEIVFLIDVSELLLSRWMNERAEF